MNRPIRFLVHRKSRELDRDGRRDAIATPYMLVVRGPDGKPRVERFKDAAAYRARLAGRRPTDRAVSLDELVELIGA